MSQAARPGTYILQPQTLGTSAAGQQGPGGPQVVQIAPPIAETHYGYASISDGTAAPNNAGPLLLDGQTSSTLPNRIGMEFYNSGSNDVEVSTNAQFTFGKAQGRTIKPGASWPVSIGPANSGANVKHYALCGPGNTCALEITEVGQ